MAAEPPPPLHPLARQPVRRVLPHRSIWSLRLPRRRLALGVALAAAFTAALLLLRPALEAGWAHEIVWWMQALEIPGHFAVPDPQRGDLFTLAVPLVDVELPDVNAPLLALHAVLAAAVWVCAGWLPDAFKPASHLLRFAVLLHSASVAYFALWPGSFLHSAIEHAGGGLRHSWALMLLTPWLHLCIHYLFPFAVWQRAALTALTLLFLWLLAPLQYASHAALLSLLGLVAMPLLHLLFGVMVPIVGLVALYGWAMSWHDPAPARTHR